MDESRKERMRKYRIRHMILLCLMGGSGGGQNGWFMTSCSSASSPFATHATSAPSARITGQAGPQPTPSVNDGTREHVKVNLPCSIERILEQKIFKFDFTELTGTRYDVTILAACTNQRTYRKAKVDTAYPNVQKRQVLNRRQKLYKILDQAINENLDYFSNQGLSDIYNSDQTAMRKCQTAPSRKYSPTPGSRKRKHNQRGMDDWSTSMSMFSHMGSSGHADSQVSSSDPLIARAKNDNWNELPRYSYWISFCNSLQCSIQPEPDLEPSWKHEPPEDAGVYRYDHDTEEFTVIGRAINDSTFKLKSEGELTISRRMCRLTHACLSRYEYFCPIWRRRHRSYHRSA